MSPQVGESCVVALFRLGRSAGFESATVPHRDIEPYAHKVGIPEAHLYLYTGNHARFLLAQKSP